jgi:hypothetical protein
MRSSVLPLFLAALALAVFVAMPALSDENDKANTHEGKVVGVSGNKLTMTDMDGKNEHSHVISASTKVTCDGKPCKLEDLTRGMLVRITTKKGDPTTILRVDASSKNR